MGQLNCTFSGDFSCLSESTPLICWELVIQTLCACVFDMSSYCPVNLWSQIIPNHFPVLLMFLQSFVIAHPYCCRSSCCDWPFVSSVLILFVLGYNFVLSACDKSMKWQHALEIFTTLKSKRLEATLYLGQVLESPWRGPPQPKKNAKPLVGD